MRRNTSIIFIRLCLCFCSLLFIFLLFPLVATASEKVPTLTQFISLLLSHLLQHP